jgi:hypothetical protein
MDPEKVTLFFAALSHVINTDGTDKIETATEEDNETSHVS